MIRRNGIYKKLILCITLLALVTFIAVVPISYAKWSGGNRSVAVSGRTAESWIVHTLSDMNNGKACEVLDKTLREEGTVSEDILNDPEVQLGGIIKTDGTVLAAGWINGGGRDGYAFESVHLEEGDTFIICIFNRIVDPSNAGKNWFTDGYAETAGNAFNGRISYSGTVFTVGQGQSGNYSFDIREGGVGISWHDIVTVNYLGSN